MQCKQTDAVCNLLTHTTQLHKLFLCPAVIFHLIEFLQRNFSIQNTLCCLDDISGTIPHSKSPKIFFCCCCQLSRRWKRIIFCLLRSHFCSIFFAKSFDTAPDPGNIILLRDQKCNDHLPQILAKDTDSTSALYRRAQVAVSWIYFFYISFIICINIKIWNPITDKLHIAAIKINNTSFLRQFEVFVSGNQLICVLFCRFTHPETLSRLADFSQAEIIQLYCNHVVLRPLHLMSNYPVFIPIAIIRAFFVFCADETIIFVLIQIYITIIAFALFVIYIICTVIAARCFQSNSSIKLFARSLSKPVYSQIFHGACPLCHNASRRFFSRKVSIHCQNPL